MMSKHFKNYLLEAGQIIITNKPAVIRTVLGSCVGVTFYDRPSKTGAMIHGLYAGSGDSALYTQTSIEMVISEFRKRRIDIPHLEVKVFGGATINYTFYAESDLEKVSKCNVDSAYEALQKHHIVVIASDTGKNCSREVLFYTHNGDVYVRQINHV